jgi:hypothetical protein
VKLKLIEKAISEHGKIYPCSSSVMLNDCFTEEDKKLLFWFNTEDNSTHLLEESSSEVKKEAAI